MKSEKGDVCKIRFTTRTGEHVSRAILIDRGGEQRLWLLVRITNGIEYDNFQNVIVAKQNYSNNLEVGYTAISNGNLVFSEDYGVPQGKLSPNDLSDVMVDIYESPVSHKLTRLQQEKEPTDFWSRYANPKGATVIGGCFRKL